MTGYSLALKSGEVLERKKGYSLDYMLRSYLETVLECMLVRKSGSLLAHRWAKA